MVVVVVVVVFVFVVVGVVVGVVENRGGYKNCFWNKSGCVVVVGLCWLFEVVVVSWWW